ncbi:MAG: histone deacetylase [Candidatus Promineifilaceae bacterium]|jgi:acetoin utilization deacetylase AcuC-like enzyme
MDLYLGFVPSPEHQQAGHPESPERMRAIRSLIDSSGIVDQLCEVDITKATIEQISFVHDERMIKNIERASHAGGGNIDADTYTTGESYRLALDAAGTTAAIVDHMVSNKDSRGFALVRPPGHHAERHRVGGFCLFNNAAIAARQAQYAHGLDRVLIVDLDVHHGNGTQDIFYEDPSVLYISTHQYGYFFYPGTGAVDEIGSGEGAGYTLNIPFTPGAGDYWYLKAMREIIIPRAREFSPDFIIVSVGYDAHWIDPLASERLSLSGYAALINELVHLSVELSSARIMTVLEGGYHLTALSHGVLNTIYCLLGNEIVSDPLGESPQREQDMSYLLSKVKELHLL